MILCLLVSVLGVKTDNVYTIVLIPVRVGRLFRKNYVFDYQVFALCLC